MVFFVIYPVNDSNYRFFLMSSRIVISFKWFLFLINFLFYFFKYFLYMMPIVVSFMESSELVEFLINFLFYFIVFSLFSYI